MHFPKTGATSMTIQLMITMAIVNILIIIIILIITIYNAPFI